MQPQIFISYSHRNKDIADTIDNDWRAVGINLTRDIRDLAFKQNIKEFMSKVKNTDYVLLLISKGYLESKNCMYEALEIFQDSEFKRKLLPILTEDAKVFNPIERINYIKYWQHQVDELNKQLKKLKVLTNTSSIYQEIDHYSKIRASIDKFIEEINSILCVNWPQVKQSAYKDIFKEIGLEEGSLLEECMRISKLSDKEERDLELDKLLNNYPNNKYILFTKGHLAYEEKQYKKARYYYEQIITIDPYNAATHNNLGVLLFDQFQEFEQAKKHYEEAIAINPNHAKAYYNLAILLAKHYQEYEQAKKHYEKALEINPNYPEAHYNLANLLIGHFRGYEQAKQHYEKVLAIDSNDSDAHFNLALILSNCFKEYEQAKMHYKNALKINPNYANAHNNLGWLLENHFQQYNQARAHYNKALKINPNYSEAHYSLAVLLEKHFQQYKQAKKHYEKALEINPTYTNVHQNLALLLKNHFPGLDTRFKSV